MRPAVLTGLRRAAHLTALGLVLALAANTIRLLVQGDPGAWLMLSTASMAFGYWLAVPALWKLKQVPERCGTAHSTNGDALWRLFLAMGFLAVPALLDVTGLVPLSPAAPAPVAAAAGGTER